MNSRIQTWPRLAAAIVVAIAVGTIWAVLLLWIGYFATQFRKSAQVYERIEVGRDGTPLIETRSSTNWLDVTYRTLDGRPIEFDSGKALPGASFPQPIKPPGLYEPAIPWSSRIAGLSDNQRPPIAWYLLRDAERIGHAYFVGYDRFSKLCVGYISRGGYTRAMPARDQWFDVGRRQLDWAGGVIASMGQVNFGGEPYGYAGVPIDEERAMAMWKAYLIDEDRLIEVDLRARNFRPVYQASGLLATALLYEASPKGAAPPAPEEAAGAGMEPSTKLRPRVALRTTESIVIVDPATDNKREYILPESLREKSLSAYALPSGELLAVSGKYNFQPGDTAELSWIRPDGSISQKKEVSLGRFDEASEHLMAWLATPMAPIPAGWATVLSVVAPIAMLQDHKAASYADALAQGLRFAGLPFLTVVLFGALLAWLTVRLQRKYYRPSSSVWVPFVFLCGLPGFFAYLIEYRRPNLEACSKCGQIVPRDRDACADCNTEFAPPSPVPTEIFA